MVLSSANTTVMGLTIGIGKILGFKSGIGRSNWYFYQVQEGHHEPFIGSENHPGLYSDHGKT